VLELEHGIERSEAPASSPNRCRTEERKWEREMVRGASGTMVSSAG
jgi:hypothetical protein